MINDIFPNGLPSYLETYYEVVSEIESALNKGDKGRVWMIMISQGRGGLYELAEILTDKFENMHKNIEWDGEFYDEIEEFLNKELYESN